MQKLSGQKKKDALMRSVRMAVMQDLFEMRKEIDRLDDEIQELFRKRMEVSREIGIYKAGKGLPVLDAAREEEKIEKLRSKEKNPEEAEAVEALYRTILKESRIVQEKILQDRVRQIGQINRSRTQKSSTAEPEDGSRGAKV